MVTNIIPELHLSLYFIFARVGQAGMVFATRWVLPRLHGLMLVPSVRMLVVDWSSLKTSKYALHTDCLKSTLKIHIEFNLDEEREFDTLWLWLNKGKWPVG